MRKYQAGVRFANSGENSLVQYELFGPTGVFQFRFDYLEI